MLHFLTHQSGCVESCNTCHLCCCQLYLVPCRVLALWFGLNLYALSEAVQLAVCETEVKNGDAKLLYYVQLILHRVLSPLFLLTLTDGGVQHSMGFAMLSFLSPVPALLPQNVVPDF